MSQTPAITLGKPDYTALRFGEPRPDRPYVIVNMVTSVDGKGVIEGNERGLGSAVDQLLMRELRANADVVISGAGTLRATGTTSRVGDEGLEALRGSRGHSRHPIAAVLSASGDLPLDRPFFTARDFDAAVYLAETASSERFAALEATGRTVVAVPPGDAVAAMLRHMRTKLAASVLLVEGGPTLNAQLFALGAIDEYFTTIGPVIVGGRDTLTPVEGAAAASLQAVTRLELISSALNAETSELYLRYRVLGSAVAR